MVVFSFYATLDYNAIGKPLYSYANLALVLLSFVFALFLTLRQREIRRFDFITISFLLFVDIMSIINGLDWKNWTYYSASIITVLLLFDYYSNNLKPIVLGMWIGLVIAVILGTFDIISHPEKWLIEDSKDITGYLLGGNYNGMGCRILIALLVNMVCLKITKWAWVTLIPLMILSLVDLFIVGSMTAVTCVILFLVLCAIPDLRIQRLAIASTLIFIILFEIFVCMQGRGLENNELATWFIVDVLGKDITFTNRTEMWDSALQIIKDSPLWGYGFPDAVWYRSYMSSFAIGPHNIILAVLIYGGIITFVLYVFLFVISLQKLLKRKGRIENIIFAAITMLSFMMLMEVYPIQIVFIFFIIAYHYSTIKTEGKVDEVEEITT